MTDAYTRAVKLATEAVDSIKQNRVDLTPAEKIALAQVFSNLAVAEALKPSDEKSSEGEPQSSNRMYGFN